MRHNYFNLNQIKFNPDGEPTVNRQSRLMSHQGKAIRNVQMSRYCPQPDSVSSPCRCRDLATPRVFSAVFSARAWKHVAMIFAVLTLSIANIGMAWGADETFTFSWTSKGTTGYAYSQAGPTGGTFLTNNAIYFLSNEGPKADDSKLNPYRVGFVFKPKVDVTLTINATAGSSAKTIQNIQVDADIDSRFYNLCKDAVGASKTVMEYALDNATDSEKAFFATVGILKEDKGVYAVASDAKSASGQTAQSSLYDSRTAGNNIAIAASGSVNTVLTTGTPASNYTFEAGKYYRVYTDCSSSTGAQIVSFTFTAASSGPSTSADTPGAEGEITFEGWADLETEQNYWKDGIKFWPYAWLDDGIIQMATNHFTTDVPVHGYQKNITAGSGWGSYTMSGLTTFGFFAMGISVTEPSVVEIIVDNNQNDDLTLANLNITQDDVDYDDEYTKENYTTGDDIKSNAAITRVDDGTGRYKVSIPVTASDLESSDPYIIKLSAGTWSDPGAFVFESVTVTPITYDVTVDDGITNGSVSASPTSAAEDETISLTVTPADGYELSSLTVTGDETGDEVDVDENEFSMPGENVTVTATFGPQNYSITLNNQSATTAGTESVTATYNANTNLTSAITCPTKTSKVFAGYFTGTDGTGVQLIDPAGNWIASAGGGSTYLDGSKNWKKADNLTLYACWMEYANTFDIQKYVQDNITDGKTSTTYTILGTNKLIYSLGGSSALDNSDKSSYEGLKMKNSGDYVMFLVQANAVLKLYFGYTGTDPKKSINGGAESNMGVSSTGTETANQEVDLGTETYDRLVKVRTVNGNAVVLQKINITPPTTCDDAYSFHYGPNGGSWETPICFTQVGETHEWNIENFTIPSHASGEFWVGYAGATNEQSVTKRWTDGLSDTGSGIMNGAMVLLPTNGSIVGQASGATGTLSIWDNSESKNQYVGFKPDGYAIMYGGNNYAFSETATSNVWETDLLTLPDVSTTYQVGIKTSSSYTTCSHSKSAEALSAPGNTMRKNGKKMLYLVPGVWRTGANNEHMAVWNATNSEWGNGGEFLTWNSSTNKYEGYVSGSAETIVFVRVDVNESSPTWTDGKWHNKTSDITLNLIDNQFSITGWGSSTSTYTQAPYSHPATGDNGKFRMYDNSNDANWYVHWIPYYKLSYDGNGGTGSVAAQYRNSELSTSPLSVAGNGFTREGWRFAGWNTNKYGTGTDYAPGDNIDITGDQTLYAKWERDIYLQSDVSWWYNDNAWFAVYCFDSEHDSNYKWVSMTRAEECSSPAVYKVALPGNNFDKVIFCRMKAADTETLSWDNKDNQTSDIAYPSLVQDKFTITNGDNGNACTGTWGTYSVPTFTISYAGGTASESGSKSDETKTCNVAFTLPGVVFSRTGYTQTGWALTENGSQSHAIGGNYTNNADQTFYPVWTIDTHTVTYNANGGSGTTADGSSPYDYGSTVTTISNSFTNSGYKFKWWNTAANGSGEDFYVGEQFTIEEDADLYAQWEEVDDDEEFWCGSPKVWHATTHDVTVGDMNIKPQDYSSDDNMINTHVSDGHSYQEYTEVNATDKHAIVMAIGADDKYVEIHFTDGSPINSLEVGVAAKDGTKPQMAVLYSTTANFSTGEYYFAEVEVPTVAQTSKQVTLANPDVSNKYMYVRIYSKISADVYGETGGSGKKLRIYSIKAKKGEVTYDITKGTPSNGSFTVTDGSSAITEAASGATVYISATPASASYEFTGWTITNTSTSENVTTTLLGANSSTASTSFSMPAYGVTVNATFALKTYTLTMTTAYSHNPEDVDEAYSITTGAPSSSNISPSSVASIPHGSEVTGGTDNTFEVNSTTVTAAATITGGNLANGDDTENGCTFRFKEWSNLPSTVIASADNVTAVYDITFNLYLKNADGTTTNASPTYYVLGEGIDMDDITDPTRIGYDFVAWYNKSDFSVAGADISSTDYGSTTRYAKWTATSYTLSYDLAGGSVVSANPSTYTIESSAITLNNPNKTGYTFAGWTGTDLGGATTTVTIAAGSTGNRSYTATWTANTYAVTLDPDNGGSTSAVTATYDAAMPSKLSDGKTDLEAPSLSNYTFGGFYDDYAGAGTQYYDDTPSSAATWDKASTATLYAKWTQTVTLDANTENGGSSDGSATATLKGTALSGISHATGAEGYSRTGYYTAATDGTKVLNADGTFAATNVTDYITSGKWTKSGATTLYAQWEEGCTPRSLSKVVLTSASAGSVTGYNYDEFAGEAVIGGLSGAQAAEVDDTHDGTETGYKLNTSGSAILFATLKKGTFQEGDQINITITKKNDNFTFPELSAKTGMDIYYGTNAGDATLLTTLSDVDAAGMYSYTLTSSDITAIGSKTGIGVFRSSTRSQNQYVYSVEIVGCREYKTEYSVTYDGNGEDSGDVPKDDTNYKYGDAVTILGNTGELTKSGYTFRGWIDGTTFYRAGDIMIMKAADVTLKAVWEISGRSETITITHFEATKHNASSSKPDAQSYYLFGYKGSVDAANAVTLTTTSSNNCGQNSGAEIRVDNGSTLRVYSGSQTTETPSQFAGITSVSFQAKLYNSGNTSRTQPYTIYAGGTSVGTGNISGLATDGYKDVSTGTFAAKNGYVDIVLTSTSSSNTNLYIDNITITHTPNVDVTFADGSVAPNAHVTWPDDIEGVPTGKKIAEPADPTANGYTFGGWYSNEGCTSGNEINWSTMTITTDKTIYAKWTEDIYTVTYDGNGSTSGSVTDNKEYKYNDFVIVSYNSGGFTRTGNYEFNGWNTKADGSGTDFDYYSYPNDHFSITQDTTLYAQWRMVVNTNTTDLSAFDAPQYKDLRITNGATLTLTEDTTVRNVLVETGSTLNISKNGEDGIKFTVKSLSLKGGWGTVGGDTKYDMPRVYIDPASTLTKTSNIVNFDIAVDNDNYYPFALPFDVPLKIVPSTTHNEDPYIVDYANSTMAYYSKYYSDESSKWQYAIKTYNGQRRANYGGSSLNWEHVDAGTTLKAGRGYALTALPASGYGDYAVIRFPMVVDNDWTTAGELGTATISDKEVTKNVIEVTAYVKAEGETAKANKGWNLLGVPYMSCYQTSADMYDEEDEDAAAIMQGKFDFETNSFKEDEIRYVSVPTHDFSEYKQYNIVDEGTKLLPGWCFFVQVASSGNLTFLDAKQAASSSIDIYAPKREQEHKPTVKTGIILSGADASDKTTILVSDKYDGTEYEINADLEKMFGENSYTLATYSLMGTTRLAYNAMSNAEARNVIPIGYRAPADGEYTFAINPRYAENFEHVNLIDYETGLVTDLLQSTYTFATERTQNDERFALNVVTRQDVITDIGNGEGANGERTNGVQKVIINDKLYIIVDGRMYSAEGALVK